MCSTWDLDNQQIWQALDECQNWTYSLIFDCGNNMTDRESTHLGCHPETQRIMYGKSGEFVVQCLVDICHDVARQRLEKARTLSVNATYGAWCKSGRHRSVFLVHICAAVAMCCGSRVRALHLCESWWNKAACFRSSQGECWKCVRAGGLWGLNIEHRESLRRIAWEVMARVSARL